MLGRLCLPCAPAPRRGAGRSCYGHGGTAVVGCAGLCPQHPPLGPCRAGRPRPPAAPLTTINIGVLITKPFLFPLMNNTCKMHASLVFSVWKSLLGSTPASSGCPCSGSGRGAALRPSLHCPAWPGVRWELRGDVPAATGGSLGAAPSLPGAAWPSGMAERCLLAPGALRCQRGPGGGLRGRAGGCARCWGLCPLLGCFSQESRAGGRADPL